MLPYWLVVLIVAATPGTPIVLTASATWTDAVGHEYCSTASYTVVVESPLQLRRSVYAPTALRDRSPAVAGVRVMITPLGSPYPVEGRATNRGTVVVDGVEYLPDGAPFRPAARGENQGGEVTCKPKPPIGGTDQ